MTVKQRAMPVLAQERIEYLIGSDRCAQRQRTARQSLAQTDDVRCDSGTLAREEWPRPTKPREHFVRDEENVVVARARSQRGERFLIVHQHAARTHEQRLDDDRGYSIALSLEQRIERAHGVKRAVEIRAHRLAPALGIVRQRAADLALEAGGGHERIDAGPGLRDFNRGPFHLGPHPDIAARGAKISGMLRGEVRLVGAREPPDAMAAGQQPLGERATDARAGAGEDDVHGKKEGSETEKEETAERRNRRA